MGYFNNLVVGGTAKFLQDVKIAGLDSTMEELNYLHKETTKTAGLNLLVRPYDYILEEEGMFAASKNTLLGFVKGNTYTLEVVMNGETMTMTGTAVDGQSETGIAGSIMVEFDGVLFFDGARWNEDFDFVAGGSLWYYFPDGVGVTKYLITGQGANGALTTVVDVYNKIPEGHLPEAVSKTPIVQEFIINEPYPHTVTGSFTNSISTTFGVSPYESNGIIFNAEDVNTTNRTFSVYAENASGTSTKIGTFTSNSSWVPEEGKGIGFMPTDAGGVFKVREIDDGFHSSRMDYYSFTRPKGYNRCHVEVSIARPYSPADGCDWHYRQDALETISILDISNPYRDDSVFLNDHAEFFGDGEFSYEYSTTSRVYSFQINVSIDIYINEHSIISQYWGNIEPIASASLADGEIICAANSYIVSHLDSYDTNMQTDIPLYLVFIVPLINGTNVKATWYSD